MFYEDGNEDMPSTDRWKFFKTKFIYCLQITTHTRPSLATFLLERNTFVEKLNRIEANTAKKLLSLR